MIAFWQVVSDEKQGQWIYQNQKMEVPQGLRALAIGCVFAQSQTLI